MDPEGVREVFFAESSVGLEYGVKAAVGGLPVRARVHESLSKGLHLPLTRPLPRRLDVSLQLSPGLHAFDAIVLADIDPAILTADELWNLLAYVEAGGGLLLMAGPNAFNKAQRGWGPLAAALPIDIALTPTKQTTLWNDAVREKAREVRPVIAADHPVARGIGAPLGETATWQTVTLRDGTVVAQAGDCPLISAATYGRGRILTVAAYPTGQPQDMFSSPGWTELLRQGLLWLFGVDTALVIAECAVDRTPISAGETRALALTLDAVPTTARATARQADPGWLAAGREPRYGEAIDVPVTVDGCQVSAEFAPPQSGRWLVRVEVEGDGWHTAREVVLEAASPAGLALSLRDGRYVMAPGWALQLRATAASALGATVTVVDFDGREMPMLPCVVGGECGPSQTVLLQPEGDGFACDFDLNLPNLEVGDYEVIATSGTEEARLRFYVTTERRAPGLTFVAPGGTGQSEAQAERMHAYYRAHGFNGISGMGGYREYLAMRDDMVLWGEYVGASLLKTHAHYGAEGTKATTPCVFNPEHAEALHAFLKERFRTFHRAPRMTYLEILDEPHLMRANVCHCDYCREAFYERYGYQMITWDEALAAKDHRTKDYFEWVVDYAGEAFRQGYKIWHAFGDAPGLNHVLCALGNGNCSARHTIAEDLPWTPHCDLIEFDCYNYMYPNWRACRKLRWNEFHFMAGHFRFLALRDRKPLGFFIQVTDRDAPVMPWDPIRAPSETLYAALGFGAKYFHLMHQAGFSNKQNCREEKFAAFGEDINKVRRAAPLLERAQAPRSHVAMVFNFHDRLYRNPEPWLPEGYVGLGFYGDEHRPYDTTWPNHKTPINVAELLVRAFGETDVIDQRVLHEGPLADYHAFVLTGVDYLDDTDARALIKFVEDGGLLICDHVPTHNTRGEERALLAPLFAGEAVHFDQDVTVTYGAYGQGQTLLFSADLNELYTGAVERDEFYLRDLIEETVRAFFFDAGLRPHALSSTPDVEVNLLDAAETGVLIAVNHAETSRQATLTVYHPPVPVRDVIDLVTGRPVAFRHGDESIEVLVELGEREGVLLGLYPELPVNLTVIPMARAARGGRLACTVALTDAQGNPVQGDHIVDLTVTDAAGHICPRYGGLRCADSGLLRLDEPLAINARPGLWTITAREATTRRVATATIAVE